MKTQIGKPAAAAALALSVALSLLAGFAAEASGKRVTRRYIGWGYEFDEIRPELLLSNLDAFDAAGLDGIGFGVRASPPGNWMMSTSHMYDGPLWERKYFEDQIPGYRKVFKHRAMRHCFLQMYRAPYKRVDWTNDAAWAHVASNLTTAAWFAKSCGFKGVTLDLEDYHNARQYTRQPSDPPYDELFRIARRRGAELFRGVFREFPDAVVFSYWMLSMVGGGVAHSPDPLSSVRAAGDLWVPFFNGMLDVAPPSVKFVDGDETAYHYDAEKYEFWRSAVRQKTLFKPLIAPKNLHKYQTQLSVSFGVYMDNYVNPEGSHHYIPPLGGSRLRRFVQNLNQATLASDEYVWFWNEKDCWVKWNKDKKLPKVTRARTYEELYPGLTRAMYLLRNRDKLPKTLPDNLVASGKVNSWSDGRDKGVFRRENGVYVATGCDFGGYSFRLEHVSPGDIYGVCCRVRNPKGGAGVSWKSGGQWRKPGVSMSFGPVDADGWQRGETIVVVPPEIDTLVLALSARGLGAEESVRFKDIGVYRLGCD